ncbi:unnamed protein product [Boreogadus saida]
MRQRKRDKHSENEKRRLEVPCAVAIKQTDNTSQDPFETALDMDSTLTDSGQRAHSASAGERVEGGVTPERTCLRPSPTPLWRAAASVQGRVIAVVCVARGVRTTSTTLPAGGWVSLEELVPRGGSILASSRPCRTRALDMQNALKVLGLDLLNAIWFSNPATAAPNQQTEGVSENNDDKVVRQFELLL